MSERKRRRSPSHNAGGRSSKCLGATLVGDVDRLEAGGHAKFLRRNMGRGAVADHAGRDEWG
jgi:hypothetical protein